MRQIGTGIVILFVLISLGIVGLGYLQQNQPQPQATPLELTLTVNPMAQDWVMNAVTAFNQSDARLLGDITITIILNATPVDDMTVWRNGVWNDTNRPDMWLPSSSLSVNYAGYPFIPENSVHIAKTPMIFVASTLAHDAITENATRPFDWDGVQSAAVAGTWANFGANNLQGNVNIAFSPPDSTMNGLMVLYGGQAYYNRALILTSITPNQAFLTWFAPIVDSVPNFNTIGDDMATFMLTRGTSVNIGIMPEAQFLNQIDTFIRNRPIVVSYPEYPVVFDFPLVWWDKVNTNLSADDQAKRDQAIQTFANWLLEPAQQAQASQYGLRPLTLTINDNDELFRKGLDVGIQYIPLIEPSLSEVNESQTSVLFSWFAQERTR
jgi:hypothetical protein